MAYITDQQINTGSFVPTTNIWEISRLYEIDLNSKEFRDLLVRLYQNVNNIALVLNTKTTGYYLTEEFATGALAFNPNSTDPLQLRPIFRKVINVGTLNAGVTTTAHGLAITSTWSFMSISGAASNTVSLNYYPLPYVDGGGVLNISVRVNGANVIITNNSGVTFQNSYIILEYLKF